MAYTKIATVHDVAPGQMKKIAAGGRTLLLANLDGSFFALDNKCPHLGGSLADGTLADGKVTCPNHGAIFDVKTGANLGSAKIAFVKMKVGAARTAAVRVEGEDVLVDLG